MNFETFTLSTSIELLLMTILGGSGTLAGPVVGTSVLFLAGQMLQGLQEWQTFAYGALLAARAVRSAGGRGRNLAQIVATPVSGAASAPRPHGRVSSLASSRSYRQRKRRVRIPW